MSDNFKINKTFGCRHNMFESQIIYDILVKLDIQNTFVFINTCAVTNEAEKQCRQEIRKTKKENPKKYLIVTGCMSQLHADDLIKMPEISFVISNNMKLKFDAYKKIHDFVNINQLNEEYKNSEDFITLHKFLVNDKEQPFNSIFEMKEEVNFIEKFIGKSRACVAIQSGCKNFCSFCIIPFTRNKIQSMNPDDVVKQINKLIASGNNEIILTGTDIVTYGKDLKNDINLGKLCLQILEKTTLSRLRLSSLDVSAIDNEIYEVLKNPRFMPFLHLSLQSGNNDILKKMNRRNTREMVIEFCNKIRNIRPDIVFGSDIIAGFSNETLEQFQDSVNIIKECPIVFVHAFPFSKKDKTLAANMPDELTKDEKKRRVNELISAGTIQFQKLAESMIGKQYQAVLEANNILRTENFMTANLQNHSEILQVGTIVNIEITSFHQGKLYGIIV